MGTVNLRGYWFFAFTEVNKEREGTFYQHFQTRKAKRHNAGPIVRNHGRIRNFKTAEQLSRQPQQVDGRSPAPLRAAAQAGPAERLPGQEHGRGIEQSQPGGERAGSQSLARRLRGRPPSARPDARHRPTHKSSGRAKKARPREAANRRLRGRKAERPSPHADDAEELPGEVAQRQGVQPEGDRPEQHLRRKRGGKRCRGAGPAPTGAAEEGEKREETGTGVPGRPAPAAGRWTRPDGRSGAARHARPWERSGTELHGAARPERRYRPERRRRAAMTSDGAGKRSAPGPPPRPAPPRPAPPAAEAAAPLRSALLRPLRSALRADRKRGQRKSKRCSSRDFGSLVTERERQCPSAVGRRTPSTTGVTYTDRRQEGAENISLSLIRSAHVPRRSRGRMEIRLSSPFTVAVLQPLSHVLPGGGSLEVWSQPPRPMKPHGWASHRTLTHLSLKFQSLKPITWGHLWNRDEPLCPGTPLSPPAWGEDQRLMLPQRWQKNSSSAETRPASRASRRRRRAFCSQEDALLEPLAVTLPPPQLEAGTAPGAALAPAEEQRLLGRRDRPADRRGEEDAPSAQSEGRPALLGWKHRSYSSPITSASMMPSGPRMRKEELDGRGEHG
ncbi:serine/arginine repetitive matrix protein 1-like [Gallus gallus]|uniref:serine/arginine repetitive matrix protein 1-like n=1 Tax=Gallus gallus TaxID=9031 RepID=UPI001AE9FD1E|nr:serine/arginine repetitive matrix protein 1-like [Gallus gallus]